MRRFDAAGLGELRVDHRRPIGHVVEVLPAEDCHRIAADFGELRLALPVGFVGAEPGGREARPVVRGERGGAEGGGEDEHREEARRGERRRAEPDEQRYEHGARGRDLPEFSASHFGRRQDCSWHEQKCVALPAPSPSSPRRARLWLAWKVPLAAGPAPLELRAHPPSSHPRLSGVPAVGRRLPLPAGLGVAAPISRAGRETATTNDDDDGDQTAAGTTNLIEAKKEEPKGRRPRRRRRLRRRRRRRCRWRRRRRR